LKRLLSKNRLLASLKSADLSLIERGARRIFLPRGGVLIEQGRALRHVYFPLSGLISLVITTPEGDAVETALVGSEGALGLTAGLGTDAVAFAQGTAAVNSVVCEISVEDFRETACRSQQVRELIGRSNEELLEQVHQTAACNLLHRLEARLCRRLLQIQDRTGSNTLNCTQEHLAQVLGTTRPSINAVAGKLKAGGFIRQRRGQTELVDRRGLEMRACRCYHMVRNHTEQVLPYTSRADCQNSWPSPWGAAFIRSSIRPVGT
jgi:CRP-like cAMP-binding protein